MTTQPLLERDEQLDRLRTLFDNVRRGVGACVLLAGEAGMGKSALIATLAGLWSADADVLIGFCDDLDTARPLGPLLDVARRLGAGFLATLEQGGRQADVFDALVRALDHNRRPVVLVFEDIHWADEATRDLVRFLSRRIAGLPVLLIVSYRDDPWSQSDRLRLLLGDLVGPQIVRLTLEPLSAAAVGALSKRATRSDTDDSALTASGTRATRHGEALHRLTGGNPFFVSEMLSASSRGLPATVRDVILSRLARLPPEVQRVVRIVSLVPGGCDKSLLAAAFADAYGAAEAAIARHATCGLLIEEDGTIGFRHELARQAIAESVDDTMAATARTWHRRFVEALAEGRDGPPPLARLAHHAAGSRDPQAIVRWALPAAVDAAHLGANLEAAKLFAAVLAADVPPDTVDRIDVCERHALACTATSDLAAAIGSRRQAIQACGAHGLHLREGDNLRWLAHLHWLDGDRALAMEASTRALELLERLPPSIELGWALAYRASFHMTGEEDDEAVLFATRALSLADTLGATEVRIHALNTLGDAEQYRAGDWRAKLEESLRLAQSHAFHDHAARAYVNLASTAIVANDFPYARDVLRQGIAFCVEHDCERRLDYLRAWLARERFESGDWPAASVLAHDLATRVRVAAVARIPALGTLAAIAIRSGAEDAENRLRLAEVEARATDEHQRIAPLLVARAEAAWLAADDAGCARWARLGLEAAIDHGSRDNFGRFAVWLWRAGAVAEARAALARFDWCPPRFVDEIEGRWADAARAWEGIGCVHECALALANGGPQDLKRSLVLLEGLGARPAVRRLRSRHSLRGAPPGPRPRTRGDAHGLTPRECEVLDLVAEGLSNAVIAGRLFLSTRTVERHVSSLFDKLGVGTRAAAAAAARARRASPRESTSRKNG